MRRFVSINAALSLSLVLSGCDEKPVEQLEPEASAQSEQSEMRQGESPQSAAQPGELRMRLESSDYRGGEHDQHWHLTTWLLENNSNESIDEAVVRVSLFDDTGNFLGHHSVTFHYLDPGGTAKQKRLLFVKSPKLGEWKPRFETVHSRAHGEISQQLKLSAATDPQAS